MDPGVDPAVALSLQGWLDQLNADKPAAHDVPFFLASYRHACEAARASAVAGKGVSTNIDCPERYLDSGDGIHAIIYREGECKKCHAVVRSSKGRVVLIAVRPPVAGRVGRD